MKLSLVVGKEIQQAKKFPMNAPGRGDNRGEGSATRILCREAGPIFADLEFYEIGRVCIAFDDLRAFSDCIYTFISAEYDSGI